MAETATSIHDVTDDLLELVLLRVPSSACLVRAAAVCKLWCRVIADARFLRRFHSLHASTVAAGYYYFNRCICFASMWQQPTASIRPSFDFLSSTAPDIDLRHFSLDFLSDMTVGIHEATILDSRGSLLLMKFAAFTSGQISRQGAFPGVLVVCEPLTKRYTRIPPPSDFNNEDCCFERSYLVDGVTNKAGGCIGMSNFRVLCELYRGGIAHATVFTAGGSEDSWTEKAINHIVPTIDYRRHILGRAGGSWYFHIEGTAVIVLDGHTGEYSSLQLPATREWDLQDACSNKFYVTDGYDGKPRIVSLFDKTMKVFARLNGSDGEWALEKMVQLREPILDLLGYEPKSCFGVKYVNDKWSLCLWMRGPGFIILVLHAQEKSFFYVDLETMDVKPAAEDMWGMLYRCEPPWPPAFSLHA